MITKSLSDHNINVLCFCAWSKVTYVAFTYGWGQEEMFEHILKLIECQYQIISNWIEKSAEAVGLEWSQYRTKNK